MRTRSHRDTHTRSDVRAPGTTHNTHVRDSRRSAKPHLIASRRDPAAPLAALSRLSSVNVNRISAADQLLLRAIAFRAVYLHLALRLQIECNYKEAVFSQLI